MERQNLLDGSGRLIAFLNGLKYFLVVYFYVVLVDYRIKREENVVYYCIILLVPMVLSLWLQQRAKYLVFFLLGQVAVICGCVEMGRDTQERVVFFLFAALQFGVALGGAMAERKRVVLNSTVLLIFLAIPGLLYAYVKQYELLFEVFLWVSVIFLWVHMWNMHLANRQCFFVEYANNADSMEKRKLLMDSNRVIGIFLSVAAIVLLVVTQLKEGSLIDRILQLFYWGLRWFLGLLTHGEVEEYVSDSVETPMANAEAIVGEEMMKQNEILSKIMAMLEAIFMFVLKFLSVFLVLAFVVFLGYRIWKSFYKKQPEREKELEEVVKIRECVKTKKEKRKFSLFGDASSKVRRLFQKKIEKQEKSGENFKRTKTSSELVDVVVEEARDTVEQMLPLYQKARYGKEKISKEELERYRKL